MDNSNFKLPSSSVQCIRAIQKQIEELEERIVEEIQRSAPLKKGDIIEYGRSDKRRKARVIKAIIWIADSLQYFCVNIKKDGTDGAPRIVTPYDNPTKVGS